MQLYLRKGTSTKLKRLKSYFKANPGALFVIAFQILLLSAGILLVSGNSLAANEVAVYSFYSLVAGVAIQVGVVVREERKRTRAAGDSQPQTS